MKNRIKKCGSCCNFLKMKNLNRRGSGLCEYHDYFVSSGDKSCEYWIGTEIPKKQSEKAEENKYEY